MKVATAAAVVLLLLIGQAPAGEPWEPPIANAATYAESRRGEVAFAIIDENGRVRGHAVANPAPAASVFKVMLLATYLRRPSVRRRELRAQDRALLGPMIRWSDNATASRIRDIVGHAPIRRLARDAGMRDFRLHPTWGLSQTSPRDQVTFMFELEEHIPSRHEAYARRLLRSIVPSQRWGIPPAVPDG